MNYFKLVVLTEYYGMEKNFFIMTGLNKRELSEKYKLHFEALAQENLDFWEEKGARLIYTEWFLEEIEFDDYMETFTIYE